MSDAKPPSDANCGVRKQSTIVLGRCYNVKALNAAGGIAAFDMHLQRSPGAVRPRPIK